MAITLTAARNRHIEFVASVPLDVINAMYFTALAESHEGLDDWPVRTRARMDPGLRDELDLLVSFPHGDAGVLGALNDLLFLHRETWGSVDDLLRFVREMPPGGSADVSEPGIRGLALHALRWPSDAPIDPATAASDRDAIVRALDDHAVTPVRNDGASLIALFDEPERMRALLLTVIRRFYDEHYRPDEERRVACLERSVAAHRHDAAADPVELSRRLTGRNVTCLETVCAGDQDKAGEPRAFMFVPSFDGGPYNSCVNLPDLHALYYPCEPRFRDMPAGLDESTQRLALVCKALGDEQRLRILALLRDGELYAQEIVERLGLHQSVVSRHLGFMRAVGLVNARRQNNMKFFSLNQEMGAELQRALDAFMPLPNTPASPGKEALRARAATVRP